MSDPARLSDKRITYSPTTSGNPSSFRSQKADGWMVRKEENPCVTFSLTQPDGETASLLEKLVIYGNNKIVAISVKKTLTGEFEMYKNEPIDLSKTNGEVSFTDGYDSGIKAHELQISLLEPIKDDLPFMARFDVFACTEGTC